MVIIYSYYRGVAISVRRDGEAVEPIIVSADIPRV